MKAITIGIVDDDKVYQFTAKKIISSLGFNETILSFFDGEDALAYLKENKLDKQNLPDTIFLDINMPNVDGWDFLKGFISMKDNFPKNIIIYMVSSSVSELDVQKAKTYQELSGYLVKPIDRDQFYEIINNIIALLPV